MPRRARLPFPPRHSLRHPLRPILPHRLSTSPPLTPRESSGWRRAVRQTARGARRSVSRRRREPIRRWDGHRLRLLPATRAGRMHVARHPQLSSPCRGARLRVSEPASPVQWPRPGRHVRRRRANQPPTPPPAAGRTRRPPRMRTIEKEGRCDLRKESCVGPICPRACPRTNRPGWGRRGRPGGPSNRRRPDSEQRKPRWESRRRRRRTPGTAG
jgi:hypothetical protein